MIHVLSPYIEWAIDNEQAIASLSDERNQLEKQRYVYEQHIAANKRQNLIKKSCLAIVNGINPFIDRILNEVYKLTEKGFIHNEPVKKEKYQYIDELVTTINEYNDILALWIKMKQGTLSLNIETFSLSELFNLLSKGRKAFEMKKQTLSIESTDILVKADKALTLFMTPVRLPTAADRPVAIGQSVVDCPVCLLRRHAATVSSSRPSRDPTDPPA